MAEPGRVSPLQYAPMAFEGWAGRVLCGQCQSNVSGRMIEAPLSQAWRDWLGILVSRGPSIAGCKVLKTSESVDVLQTMLPASGSLPDLAVVAKQSRSRSLLDSFRGSAAKRNFNRGLRLREAGIATALPLAYLERKTPPASWLITEYLDHVVDLDAYVLAELPRGDAAKTQFKRKALSQNITGFFRGLEQAGLYHRDMKASNILISMDSKVCAPRVCVVDLEGLSWRMPWRSRWKPIARLAASLLQYRSVGATDHARFLRDYLSQSGDDEILWRKYFQRLRKEAARYSQAAQKRKRGKLDGYV